MRVPLVSDLLDQMGVIPKDTLVADSLVIKGRKDQDTSASGQM